MNRLTELSTRASDDLDKKSVKAETLALLEEFDELQNRLYAGSEHSVLIILQGMDASGKDGAIKKVFSHLNPQGIRVQSFKVPTEEELKQDFLWRIHKHAPEKGMIQIFNRSHYEDVLVTRVHGIIDDEVASQRFDAINQFEELLVLHNATRIFKFYLHISPEEQSERFAERVQDERKKWKYNANDDKEAKHWDKYREVYEDVFENCDAIPWHLIPADQNWYKEYLITKTIVEGLRELELKYPEGKQERS